MSIITILIRDSTTIQYCKFGNFCEGYILAKLRICEVFMKIKSSRNAEITQSFTDIGKSCPSRTFLASQICLLALLVKIKFSGKFPDLQFITTTNL